MPPKCRKEYLLFRLATDLMDALATFKDGNKLLVKNIDTCLAFSRKKKCFLKKKPGNFGNVNSWSTHVYSRKKIAKAASQRYAFVGSNT